MITEAHKPLRIFCSYAHEDEEHLNDLQDWLRGLQRQGLIEWWHDRGISPGWEWEEAIDKNLRTADIILLLVTPDFMASDYVFEKEIRRAIERHERGEARVIPIIVRPALWKGTVLDRLQALPKDARPVTRWPDRDEAWLDVAQGIRKAVEELLAERQQRAARKEQYRRAVEEAWDDNRVTEAEAERLGALASELSLSTDTTADIEREVMGDTKETILGRQEQASREKERQDRLDELYARARRSHQNREWQAVVDVLEQIRAEDPDYPDPARLLASAHEALKTQQRMQRVAALYDRGQRHIDAEEWQLALKCFEEVQRLEPGYRETEELMSRVRQELAPPPQVGVPGLTGQRISQASSTLSQRGLRLGAQNEVSSDTVPEGQIVTQTPEAGTEVEAGNSVDVTVSSGPSTVEAPDLAARRSESGGWTPPVQTPPPAGTPKGDENGAQPGRRAPVWLVAVAAVFVLALLGSIVVFRNREEQPGNQQGIGGQPADTIYDRADVLTNSEEQRVQKAFDQAAEDTGHPLYAFVGFGVGERARAQASKKANVPPDAVVIWVYPKKLRHKLQAPWWLSTESQSAINAAVRPHFGVQRYDSGLVFFAAKVRVE
jgi:hypothetical protein